MKSSERVRIAIQKSGRLSDGSLQLFTRCGLDTGRRGDLLLSHCANFPVEFMYVRDDDIPEYVRDGVCDLGIVGRNVLTEKQLTDAVETLRPLGFGHCRLALAVPAGSPAQTPSDLAGKRIATSYPATLTAFMRSRSLTNSIVEISGSVEIAPSLNIADAVCDLVSSGSTLRANGLREIGTVLESQAVLIRTAEALPALKNDVIGQFLQRVDGVSKADRTKYIMMNAPESRIDAIKEILPGLEEPTIVPLTTKGKVAVHAVAREEIFWETMERLKSLGASSILVVPIEKIID